LQSDLRLKVPLMPASDKFSFCFSVCFFFLVYVLPKRAHKFSFYISTSIFCWVLHQGHRSGAQNRGHLQSWLSPLVTIAKSPPRSSPAGFLTHIRQKCPPQCSSHSTLTNYLMPVSQQDFSLPWGYKNWLLLPLLRCFSRVRFCATPQMAAHQAPPSLGFSRQEHWSGWPFPSPMHESEKWKWSHSVVSDS